MPGVEHGGVSGRGVGRLSETPRDVPRDEAPLRNVALKGVATDRGPGPVAEHLALESDLVPVDEPPGQVQDML
jgi:hypothetical protein